MPLFRRRRPEPAPEPVRVPGPVTPELVSQVAAGHLAPAEVEVLVAALRPSLRLVHAADAPAGAPVVARLGGRAAVLGDASWPTWQDRPLSLVASLDLAALRDVALPDDLVLPAEGTLSFFYDADEQSVWGFDPADRGGWRVVHAATSRLTDAPEDAVTFPAVPLAARHEWTVPDPYEPVLDGVAREPLLDVFDRLPEPDETAHRLGGWPDLVQGPLWLGAQLASSGIYVGGPEGYRDPRAPALEPGAADWRLLLQVDSDDAAEMMWGDVGRLYFLARVQDLRRGAVEDGWFELQCG